MEHKLMQFKKFYRRYLEGKYENKPIPIDRETFQRIDLHLSRDNQLKARNEAIREYKKDLADLPSSSSIIDSLNNELKENQRIDQRLSTGEWFEAKEDFKAKKEHELQTIDKHFKAIPMPEEFERVPVTYGNLTILERNEDFYIGREGKKELPEYNSIEIHEPKMLAGPFFDRDEAEKELDKFNKFREILPGIGEKNLEVCARGLEEDFHLDPQNVMKAALIRDHLQHDREEPKKEMMIEETFSIEFRER